MRKIAMTRLVIWKRMPRLWMGLNWKINTKLKNAYLLIIRDTPMGYLDGNPHGVHSNYQIYTAHIRNKIKGDVK